MSGSPLQSVARRSPGSDVASLEVHCGSVSSLQAGKNGAGCGWLALPCRCLHRPSCALVLLPQHAAFAVTESFVSPSETVWASCGPNRLSTLCARVRAPLMRFLQRPPLRRRRPLRPAARSEDLVEKLPTSPAVPSMPFLTTSTGSSADDLVGLLHPTTDHGVHPVSCRPSTFPPSSDTPHGRLTLRSFPLPTRWTPSPGHCWSVHRVSCPSRGWPSSVLRSGRNQVALRKSPPPQGCPSRESVARPSY
jgi:hypothetical protein